MEVPSATRARPPRRRAGGDSQGRGSCDVLLQLARSPQVASWLAEYGVTLDDLKAARLRLTTVPAEPVDWRARLAQRRGAGAAMEPDLDELLAIVRTAESHAYQLLESVGVSCARLRRRIIDHVRARGDARKPSARTPTKAPTAVVAARVRERRNASPPTRLSQAGTRNRAAGPARPPRTGGEPGHTPAQRSATESAVRQRSKTSSATPGRNPKDSEKCAKPSVDQPIADLPIADPQSECDSPAALTTRVLTPIRAADLPVLCGRDQELARLADAVLRRCPRGPVVVGPHGSGRSLLARHLAGAIEAPVFALRATDYDDEDALACDLRQVRERSGIAILDDLDHVTGEAAPVALSVLAQTWSGGDPPVVTLVSPDGWERLRAWAPGLLGVLEVLPLEPLSGTDLDDAVRMAVPRVLAQHGLSLAEGTDLHDLVRVAARYWPGLASPGNVIDLFDLACARTVRRGQPSIRSSTWIELVCERVGIPAERLERDEDRGMLDLEQQLARRVVGHGPALRTLAGLIRRNRAGFASPRPVATALLLGPSGVGKTEIAKALAAALFEHEDALVRLDMSEYAEAHAVARIVGAPPGYVGHEHGGAMTEPLARRGHCVVLLDEIEKAHRDVHQLLLQVFDEGRLTDGRGRLVDFRHAVVVMTSNLGADLCRAHPTSDQEQAVLAMARAAFPVELWNRIEAPLVLGALSHDELHEICCRLAQDSSERLFAERGIRYTLTDDASDLLVTRSGRDPTLGARPLRHWLAREVETLVADAILRGRLRPGTQAVVDAENGRLRVR